MLFLIGLGLGDEKDITVKGLEAVRSCARVFLEAYTSVLGVSREKLEAFYGRPIEVADREFIESEADKSIIGEAAKHNVAVLIVGDPFGATTHTDLTMRARKAGVPVKVIHNASIMNAMGCSGLQLYHFGQAVTIVFFTETWRPDSFYDKILSNRRAGLHTLCLLDIKMKEISELNLARGKKIYEPPRFLTINQALEELLEIEDKRKEKAYSRDTYCIGLARVGQDDQRIVSGSMGELLDVDFGSPLHSLIISGTPPHALLILPNSAVVVSANVVTGEMHFLEKEHADCFLVKPSDKRNLTAPAAAQPVHP